MPPNAELESVVRRLYAGYGRADVVGIPYFRRFLGDLEKHDFVDLVECEVRMDHIRSYTEEFLLGTPFLWQHLDPEVWPRLLRRQEGRPSPALFRDADSAAYADVEFLTRYAQVDALEFLVRAEGVSAQAKARLLRHMARLPLNLVNLEADLDDEWLDGVKLVDKRALQVLGDELRRGHGFRPVDFGEADAAEHVRRLAARACIEL
jgi:hypothetical protein